MFDRFTERARQVMALARQEAQKLNNDYIGTEHILLGLVQEGSGVAAQVLKNLDVDLRKVRVEVERLVQLGNSPVSGSQLPFTPRAKRVLEIALEEAQNLGHNYIGTEHLLLGLIHERDGPAAHVLQNLGVKREEVREEVVELIGADPRQEAGEERPGWIRRMLGGASATRERPHLTPGWESVPKSPAVDWLLVARMKVRATAMVEEGLPWATPLVHFELLPGPGDWEYRLSVGLVPREGRGEAICITVPGGPLKDLEKDLPGLIGSLLKSIEGKGEGGESPAESGP
jgi:hypothetical protein